MIAELASLIEPIVKTLNVGSDAAEAFKFFTGQFGTWWPVHDPKYTEQDAKEVVMEPQMGGRIYSVRKDGTQTEWGLITDFEEGARVAFSWHLSKKEGGATQVEVTFKDEGEGRCTVTLTHSGWENWEGEAEKMRHDYDEGWDHVLDECFAPFAGGQSS